MLLQEMFSAIGAPQEGNDDIDWANDLKFFIDNDDSILSDFFFPAIKKHKEWHGHPDAYKLYIKPLEHCSQAYCEKFGIDGREEKFPKETLIQLAREIADAQHQHIEDGDYED